MRTVRARGVHCDGLWVSVRVFGLAAHGHCAGETGARIQLRFDHNGSVRGVRTPGEHMYSKEGWLLEVSGRVFI